ncbi:siphovirus Gp157 family protein [Methylobacter sp.]|uniref:siphovirus Gp157 family protein n=1 Tax=Methylobacter sp. TaxID=2051955 RepID=UPI002FDE6FF0
MNRLSLYELSANYLQALDFLTDPEMDLPIEAVNDTLEALGGELEDKAINVAKFFRNMEAAADAIKTAEANMAKRRKALENRVQWLKNYIKGNMELCGISDIECPHFKLSIQKNPAVVNIIDEDAIPEQFKEKVISWKIDKTAIKDAIKSGSIVPGTELINGTRLAVK